RAGALAALATWPEADVDAGDVADLIAHMHDLNLFGKAMLLQAAVAVEDQESADTIAHALFASAEVSSCQISFNESRSDGYASLLVTQLRANGEILDGLSRYEQTWGNASLIGDPPQKLMRWITQARTANGS